MAAPLNGGHPCRSSRYWEGQLRLFGDPPACRRESNRFNAGRLDLFSYSLPRTSSGTSNPTATATLIA